MDRTLGPVGSGLSSVASPRTDPKGADFGCVVVYFIATLAKQIG